jgi:drug/metabolite transporter (DMT)-like permease
LLLACPGTSLPLLLTIAGFARTSALEGGLLLQLNGVAALLFAMLLLGERIRWRQGFGVLLLLLGGALIVIAGAGGTSGDDISGNLLILVGTVGIGFSYIPAKRLADRADPLPLTAARLLLGGATMAPVAAFQLLAAAHALLWQPTQANLALLLLYVLTNFCVAFFAQQAGLRLLKAWQMAAIGQTVPLFSTFFAVLLLHDSLTLLQGAGGLLAIFGGIIVSLNNATPAAPAAVPTPAAVQTKQGD